jgi:hypothetical protein
MTCMHGAAENLSDLKPALHLVETLDHVKGKVLLSADELQYFFNTYIHPPNVLGALDPLHDPKGDMHHLATYVASSVAPVFC